MKNNLLKDMKSAANLFVDMRKARKEGREIVVEQKVQIPLIRSSSFYNTVEGCTLSWLDQEITDKAREAFNAFSDEVKYRLQFSPKDGEFIERARLWREMLSIVMTEKQCHIAMNCIIEWYIHIKQMHFEKGGAI